MIHIIVDDGSTEDVKGFISEYGDERVRYVRRDRTPYDQMTSSNAMNLGIEFCLVGSGDTLTSHEAKSLKGLAYLHSDDLLAKESVQKRLAVLTKGFVASSMLFFNNKGQMLQVRPGITPKHGLDEERYHSFNHHTTLWEIGFLQYLREYVHETRGRTGIFNTTIDRAEDVDVTLHSVRAGLMGNYAMSCIPDVSVYYRVHSQSVTGDLSRAVRKSESFIFNNMIRDIHALKKRAGADIPWSLLTVMPSAAKRGLRPVKEMVKHLYSSHKYPEIRQDLALCLDSS